MATSRDPTDYVHGEDGPTMVEYFAAAAMNGFLSRERGQVPDNVPNAAYCMAEAMVVEYNKRYGANKKGASE